MPNLMRRRRCHTCGQLIDAGDEVRAVIDHQKFKGVGEYVVTGWCHPDCGERYAPADEDDGQPTEYDEWQDYFGGDNNYFGDDN